jgi:hypothetical protein
MRQRRVAFRLMGIGLLFVVAAVCASTVQPVKGADPESVVVIAPDPAPTDLPAPDEFTPVACKMEPQCSTDADCFAWCGVTGGHCVHSSCPIRICKCR